MKVIAIASMPKFLVALVALMASKPTMGFSVPKPITKTATTSTSTSTTTSTQLGASTRRDPMRMPSQTPMVPYKAPGSTYTQFIDINAAMYRDRTLMISKFIDESAANEIISIILYMRKENPREPISIYFNCPGALLRPALAVYDLLLQTKENCDIETVNLGLCAGMASLLASAGTKGKRSAMPNARFLLQRIGLEGTFRGQATDIALEVKNVKTWNERMEKELALLTGQSHETLQRDLKRDFYLSSDEAVQYGLIDQVLLPSPRKRAARGQDADLGAFEGQDEQRYQNQPDSPQNKGGWGSNQQQQRQAQAPPSKKNKKDDDDGPEILKG